MDKNELQLFNIKSDKLLDSDLVVGYLNNVYLYSSLKVDSLNIRKRKIKNILSKIVLVVLFIVALAGIFLAGYLIYNNEVQYLFIKSDVKSFFVKFFWITTIFDMYLIYKISSQDNNFKIVMKIDQDNDNYVNPLSLNIDQWDSLNRSYKIDISKSLDVSSVQVIDKAYELALKYKHSKVTSYHYLLASIFIPTRIIFLVNRLGLDPQTLVDKLSSIASRYDFSDKQAKFDKKANTLLLKAYRYAFINRVKKISPTEIFAISYLNDENIQEVFYDLGVEIQDVKNTLVWLDINEQLLQRYERYKNAGKTRSKYGIDRALTSLSTQFLDKYSEDITRYAQNGYLELVVGRDKEINEILRIYQSGKRSLILTGSSGVGKNAIIEGISQKIIGNDVPSFLKEKRILLLDISVLVAGVNAQVAQERLLKALSDAITSKNVVLYIKNIHDLVGISSAGGQTMDLSSVLSNVLEKNLFYFISTTSNEHYNNLIEQSPLYSTLHRIEVNETNEEDTIRILESKVGYVENINNIIFSYQSLKKIVEYTKRYIHGQFFPIKAIQILEEIGAYVKNSPNKEDIIIGKTVAEFLTQKLGIPIKDVDETESKNLLNLEEILHRRVVGQDEAVKAVSVALKRARTQLRDENRPIANMLFLGPTGVGKTELVKTIAASYFGNETNMIRLDMSEYQSRADVYKILGSPTGDNQQKTGYLTQLVKDNPYTIVLLDEFEKAHQDVLNIFLQVMEDGRLTDAKGDTIDFTNTITIATSNAGSQYIQDKIREGENIESIKKGLLESELKTYFKPELLNRFDSVVVFKPLQENEIKEIAKLLIDKISDKLKDKGITLEVTDEFITELAKKGYDPLYGARSLRRVIQDEVDNDLADFLLENKIERRDIIILDIGNKINIKKAQKL